MRILLVNDYAEPIGGAEIAQEVLREALLRRGHEVRTFAARLQNRSAADYSCFGTASRFRTLLQALNPWAAIALRRAIADFGPDVVHVRVFLTQLSPLILPVLRDVPSLHHMTWYRSVCPVGTKILPDGRPCTERAGVACCRNGCLPRRDWLPMLVQMRLLRKWRGAFRLSVSNSEEGRAFLHKEGIGPVEKIWNGVAPAPARPPLPEVPTLFFAGRLVRQKGADVLLRAFASVAANVPGARLSIAGDGPERAGLIRLREELHLAGSVSLLGRLSRTALEREAAKSWAQVVPSRPSESFGNVAAEAMMRGTAVIASATGGMPEYIRDGECGILVLPGNEDALADALLAILRDRDLAERMGRRGREIALEKLSADRCASRFEAVYQSLLQDQPAEPRKK